MKRKSKASKSTEKSLSKIPTRKEYEAFTMAHQNILLERMEKNFAILGEGQTLLCEKVESLDQRMESFEYQLGFLGQDMKALNQKVEVLDQKVDSLDQKVDRHYSEFKSEMIKIYDKFDRFEKVERRVAVLESQP